MIQLRKIAVGIAAALGLGFAVAAFAQPNAMGGGGGQSMAGMHDRKADMQTAMHGGSADHGAAQQFMPPQERVARQERMRNAKTPEERQALAKTMHTEMEKRAKGNTITLPGHGGMGTGMQRGHGQMGVGGNGSQTAAEHAH